MSKAELLQKLFFDVKYGKDNEVAQNILDDQELQAFILTNFQPFIDLVSEKEHHPEAIAWGAVAMCKCIPNYDIMDWDLLDLSGLNNLMSTPSLEEDFFSMEACKNLWKIDFSDHHIQSLPKSILTLPKLTEIFLSYNKMTDVPPIVYEIKKLKYLVLVENKLTHISPKIEQLEKLTFLNLLRNNIQSLPDEVYQLKKLSSIRLEENPELTEISDKVADLPNLRYLELAGTGIPLARKEELAKHLKAKVSF